MVGEIGEQQTFKGEKVNKKNEPLLRQSDRGYNAIYILIQSGTQELSRRCCEVQLGFFSPQLFILCMCM